LQEITAGFRLLAFCPEAGHVRQDLTPLPIKFWPAFSYLVVYDPAARPLAIVRVPSRQAGCRGDPSLGAE
jgi:antitoxin ParD1/3/4/toxin ParE1/3/4